MSDYAVVWSWVTVKFGGGFDYIILGDGVVLSYYVVILVGKI